MDHCLAGLDIGGTKTAVLVVDEALNVCARTKSATQVSDPQSLVSGIADAIHETLEAAGASPSQLVAIGAGTPGHVEPQTGEVRNAVNLNLDVFPLGPALEGQFGVPVALENDVKVAALGAYEWLQGRKTLSSLAYMSIGTGISAAMVANGRVFRGARGMAGEIGHVVFEPDGPLCVCGMRGCLEAIAAGPAIARLWQDSCPDGGGDEVTAESVYAAAAKGQSQATAVIRRASKVLARAVHLLVNLYDVEMVVLGGGVSGAGSAFMEPILSALSEMRSQSTLIAKMLPPGTVIALPVGHDAATWGAIKLAQQLQQ